MSYGAVIRETASSSGLPSHRGGSARCITPRLAHLAHRLFDGGVRIKHLVVCIKHRFLQNGRRGAFESVCIRREVVMQSTQGEAPLARAWLSAEDAGAQGRRVGRSEPRTRPFPPSERVFCRAPRVTVRKRFVTASKPPTCNGQRSARPTTPTPNRFCGAGAPQAVV